jgi:ribosomal protein L11 methyltransferase
MPWLKVQIRSRATETQNIEQLFEDLGAISVTLEDAQQQSLYEPKPDETPLWEKVEISALFESSITMEELRKRCLEILGKELTQQLVFSTLEDQQWERVWLDHFRPMRFGKRLWICPSHYEVNEPDSCVVYLDPGLAFGTGTHNTTALCLNWLDSAILDGKTVIDFGCGSGILAIAALKLGARTVIATDHDEQAIMATRENSRRNQLGDQLMAISSSHKIDTQADLLIANIVVNVLIEMQETISSLVAPGGTLVLSGILRSQVAGVIAAYSKKFVFSEPTYSEEWVLLQGTAHR